MLQHSDQGEKEPYKMERQSDAKVMRQLSRSTRSRAFSLLHNLNPFSLPPRKH